MDRRAPDSRRRGRPPRRGRESGMLRIIAALRLLYQKDRRKTRGKIHKEAEISRVVPYVSRERGRGAFTENLQKFYVNPISGACIFPRTLLY